MEREEQKAEVAKRRELPIPKYMMGTKAYHQLGDISNEPNPDLFQAYAETDDYWVGAWVFGFGFINVLFPKSTSRELTPEEVEYWNKKYCQIGSQPAFKLKVD